jgi:hypothetical protein
MRHALIRHPDTPASAVTAIAVEVTRGPGGTLALHYFVSGAAGAVVPAYPSPATRKRKDELWLETCFEAFVKPAGGEAYWEFNLAPNWDWQAYGLTGYRQGRHPAGAIAVPVVSGHYGTAAWDVRAEWTLNGVPDNDLWHLALAAVVRDANGAISYWALRHAPGKPDFHHADAFALDLTP